MIKPERINDYLEHILEASNNIQVYVDGYDYAEFVEDVRTQQAVTMNLIIIGEATTKLMDKYPEFTQQEQQVPWLGMRGMRNRIAHGYFDINLEVVWQTIKQAIPELAEQIKQLLKCRI